MNALRGKCGVCCEWFKVLKSGRLAHHAPKQGSSGYGLGARSLGFRRLNHCPGSGCVPSETFTADGKFIQNTGKSK